MRRLTTVLRVVFIVGAIAFAFAVAGKIQWSDVFALNPKVPSLVFAVISGILSVHFFAQSWLVLVDRTTSEAADGPYLRKLFAELWISRYVPGKLAPLAGKMLFAKKIGLNRGRAIVMSVWEEASRLLIIGAIGLGCLVALQREVLALVLSWLAFAAALAAIVGMCNATLAKRVIAFLVTASKRFEFVDLRITIDQGLYKPMVFQVLGVGLSVVSYLCALDALQLRGEFSLAKVLVALAMANILGVVIPLAPAGIGVKDGALAFFLAEPLGHEAAIALTIVHRLVTVSSDGLYLAIAYLSHLFSRRDSSTMRRPGSEVS